MTAEQRREQIEKILMKNTEPITATTLSKQFSVSRQVIVGDVALMRAAGLNVTATPRGYILNVESDKDNIFTIACMHGNDNMQEELYTIVDNGGNIIDVTVEHPVYGEISGELYISTRYEADLFLEKIKKNEAQPLMNLTDGIHLHTINCSDKNSYERIIEALKKKNILLEQK